MADCVDYACGDLDDYLQNTCNEILLGGVPEVLIFLCGHTVTDPSNATQINNNIATGLVKLMSGIKMGIPKASAVKIPSPIGGQPDVLLTYDRTATLIDANVNTTNITFYNQLLAGRTIAGIAVHESDPDQITYYDAIMSFTGSRVIPDNNGDYQRFEVDIAWRGKLDGIIYSSPVGVFSY